MQACLRIAATCRAWWGHAQRPLLAGMLLGCLGFGLLLVMVVSITLDHTRKAAERDALARVDSATQAVVQLMRRNLEGIDLYFELLRDLAQARADNSDILPGVEHRLRSFAAAQRFGVYHITLLDPDAQIRWTNLTGAINESARDRMPHAGNLERDQGLFIGTPVVGRISGRLGILFTSRLTLADGSYAGVGALSVDPNALAMQLNALRSLPHERINLWREQGERLATSDVGVLPDIHMAASLRPGPDGRLLVRQHGARTAEDRFFAIRKLEGVPMFFSVSRLAEPELAGYRALQGAVLWAAGLLYLLALMGTGLAWMLLSRRRARQVEMEAQRIELARVLDGVQAAVALIQVDADGRHRRTYISAGAARLLRVPRQKLLAEVGFNIRMQPDLSVAERHAQLAELRTTGQVTFERQTLCGDGTLRWMRYARSVIGRHDDVLEVVSLVTDIEQMKAAEAAAISSARLATLGELSANLAHEMNQPLTVIALSAETARMMAQQDEKAALLAGLDRILVMVARTRLITDHLRNFARTEEPELDSVRLDEVLAGALMLTAGSLAQAHIVVERALPPGLPAVLGRQVMLEQVLMNLLLNARDAMAATPAGQRLVRIAASVEPEVVHLTVADSGPGVAPHLLPRLFEPFFTTKPAGQGTGLGLSICHGVLQACGGSILAANRPEGGALFTLTLQRADQQARAELEEPALP